MSDVVLRPVLRDERKVLFHLLQLYIYDFSTIRPFEVNSEGTYSYRYFDSYFEEENREACFVEKAGVLVGFTMTRETAVGPREVAEFFILRRHRRSGVGSKAARLLFARHPGQWVLHFDTANSEANEFWPRTVDRYGTEVSVTEKPDKEFPKVEIHFVV